QVLQVAAKGEIGAALRLRPRLEERRRVEDAQAGVGQLRREKPVVELATVIQPEIPEARLVYEVSREDVCVSERDRAVAVVFDQRGRRSQGGVREGVCVGEVCIEESGRQSIRPFAALKQVVVEACGNLVLPEIGWHHVALPYERKRANRARVL